MTKRAGLAVWLLESWSTLAVTSLFSAVSGRVEIIAIASYLMEDPVL